MFKNVVFDFGQVLVRFSPEYITAPYVGDEKDRALVAKALFDRALWDPLDAGTITDEEVVASAAARLPERLRENAEKAYYNWPWRLPEIEGMRKLAVRLKEMGARLFVLSNISTYFAAHRDAAPILDLMDGCVFSAVCGHTKPGAAIFEHLCSTYSLDPAETVFIDDNPANAAGAEAFGISAYRFDGDVEKLSEFLLPRVL